jgi:methionyl aminopeptidase
VEVELEEDKVLGLLSRKMIKTQEEIELIRESSLLVSKTLAELASHIKPGITPLFLDKIAEEFIRDHGAVPGFKGYGDFPNTLCFSMNSAVVHGIPSNTPLKEGDVLSIDCGTLMNEFYGDQAFTFAMAGVQQEVLKLLQVTRKSLDLGIEQAVVGKRVGDIGFAIQQYCEKEHGYGVVRELVGHGLGKSLHEDPEVPNYGRKGQGVKLRENMVLAIEPMVNLGTRDILTDPDGWTILTRDGKVSAHYEHDIVVKQDKAEVLTDFGIIDQAISKNKDLQSIVV